MGGCRGQAEAAAWFGCLGTALGPCNPLPSAPHPTPPLSPHQHVCQVAEKEKSPKDDIISEARGTWAACEEGRDGV